MKFQIVKLNQSTIYEFAFEQAMALRTKRIEMASNYLRTHTERGRRKAVNGCMYLLFNTLSLCVLILIMNLDAIYQITQRVNYFVVNRNSYWGNRSEARALTSLSVCVFFAISEASFELFTVMS